MKKVLCTIGIVIVLLTLVSSGCAPAPTPVPPTSVPAATATSAPASQPTTAPSPAATRAPTTAPTATAAPTAGPKVLRIGQVGNIQSLEPYRYALPNYLIIEQVFDQMLFNQEGTKLVAEAAESWQLAPDNKSITLKLRPGMTTHDGSKVDAEMVKWDLEQRATQADKGQAMYQQIIAYYDRAEVVDPLTLVIRFKIPCPQVIDLMATFAITDPDMFTKKDGTVALANGEDKQIGTGPFKMVEYVPGDHMYLERFKDYWEKDAPTLDRIEIRIFGDNASMVAALQAGEIDMAFRPAFQDATRLQKDSRFTVWVPKTEALIAVLMINPASEPLKDVRVRQAITVAIDREAINQVAFSGLAIPTGVVVPKNSLAYSPDLELKTTADTAKASALLKDAGVTSPQVKITYDSSDGTMQLEAQIIADNLRAVGINAQLDPTETSVYTQRRTSQQFDLLLSVVSGTNLNPANLEGSFVYLHVDNPFFAKIGPSKEYQAYSQAFGAALAAKSETEAKTAWQNALKAIRDGAWVTSLTSSPNISITSSKVKGLTWTEADKPVLKYVTISP